MEHLALTPQADELKVRDRLLAAATRLFAEKGYAATSVSEIVAAAGVTKPILYYYFKSKEGIYLEILDESHHPFDELMHESASWDGTARERILRLAIRMYDQFLEHVWVARMICGIFYGPAQGAPFFDFVTRHALFPQAIRKIVDDGIAAGELKTQDPQDMTMGIVGLIWMVLDNEICQRPYAPGREGMTRILSLFFEGIEK